MFEIQMLEEFVRRSDHHEASDFRISISTNANPILGKADRLILVGCDLGSLFGRLAAQKTLITARITCDLVLLAIDRIADAIKMPAAPSPSSMLRQKALSDRKRMRCPRGVSCARPLET
jgi:hypothetical protein